VGSSSKVIVLEPVSGCEGAGGTAEAAVLEAGAEDGVVWLLPPRASGVVEVWDAEVDTGRSQFVTHSTAQINAAVSG
jgi:hypothetical protein